MAFFIGWQLWQQLSFVGTLRRNRLLSTLTSSLQKVLACLIAIVFMIGFVKLWRTNQILRRYERLDEEKRARLAEMQQQGLDIPAVNEIPFGSRAIQSGIEVDDIWISRPNTPVPSHGASCATTMDQGSIDSALASRTEPSSTQHGSESSFEKLKGKAVAQSPRIGLSKIPKRSTLSEQPFSEPTTSDGKAYDDAIPTSSSQGINCPVAAKVSQPSYRWSSIQNPSDVGPVAAPTPASNRASAPVPFGTAEVFANTSTRRTPSGFEIFPAGSLGKRVELGASECNTAPFTKEEARTPTKLQKPKPTA